MNTWRRALIRIEHLIALALVLVSPVLSSVSLAQDTTAVLTLEQAIELGLRNSPTLATADGSVAIAETQELEADLVRWLPTFSARSTIAPSGPIRGNALESTSGTDLDALGDLGDDLGYQTNNSIRAVLPLYGFGKISLAQDLAELGVHVAQLERRKAELELSFNVRRAYAGLQLSHEFDEMLADGQRRLRSARESLETRLLEGDASARTELRQLTISEANFVGLIADNRMLARISRRGLEYYCGIDTPFVVEPFDDSVPEHQAWSVDALMNLAWEHRPDLALLDQAVRARELRSRLARRRMLPNLFFALGFTFNHNPLADDQPSPFAYDPYNSSGFGFFLGLDWSFNFRQVAQARRRDAEESQTRNQLEEAIGAIEIEVEESYLQALGHFERVEAYAEAHRAASAWLRQRTLQFDSGLADFDDLKDPLVAYFGAFGNYYQALFDYRMACADLAVKVGLNALPSQDPPTDPSDESEGAE